MKAPVAAAVLLGLVLPHMRAVAADVRTVALSCVNAAESCSVQGVLLADGREVPLRGNTAEIPNETQTVELRAEGYWMPPQAPAPQLRVWRTALLRGRFQGQQAKEEMPATFKLRFESPPMTPEPRVPSQSEIECPVARDGSWSCALPATTLDVALRAKGFTPHYLWDVKVPRTLATVTLKRGASFVAWIDRSVAEKLETAARAKLVRAAMSEASVTALRLAEPVAEATFNKRGMVQLAPVPPGMYTLEIAAPGFATTRLENIEIFEGRESSLRRVIELQPPLTIALRLQPAVDPTGTAWTVDLHHYDPIVQRPTRVRGGAFRAPGLYEVKGQAPGRYTVTISDARGNDYASRHITITSQADAHHSIELALKAISGIVTIGETPIAATLLFGGNGGQEQIEATADADGKFDVTLPRRGRWKVDVENARDGVDAAVEVMVDEDAESLRIVLPDTEVSGWVLGSDGARLPKADIAIHTSAGPVMQYARGDGTFRFRGVAPGAAKIYATHPATDEESRARDLTIVARQPIAGLELPVEPASDLAGIVISNGQPVVGARVLGYGYVDGFARQEKTVTALDGSFRLQFPDAAREVVLLVAAAGRTMQGYSIVGRPRSTTLDLAAAGGTLRLEWEKSETRPDLRIFYNGVLLPLNDVLLWARSHGQNIVNRAIDIPHLAPGSYRFCNGARCVDGVLPARGSLTLRATR